MRLRDPQRRQTIQVSDKITLTWTKVLANTNALCGGFTQAIFQLEIQWVTGGFQAGSSLKITTTLTGYWKGEKYMDKHTVSISSN